MHKLKYKITVGVNSKFYNNLLWHQADEVIARNLDRSDEVPAEADDAILQEGPVDLLVQRIEQEHSSFVVELRALRIVEALIGS